MTDPILEIKELSVHFQQDSKVVKAVDGISLTLDRGTTTGLVGESGSGKSVTAKAVLQLLQRDRLKLFEGSIRWKQDNDAGRDLMTRSESEMEQIRGSQIGMVFQDPMASLNPILTCGQQILEVVRKHQPGENQPEKLVKEWLVRVQLPEPDRIYTSYPHQISGGQQQRVMIAMAMAANPALLIADEPTTALDVTVQRAILDLLAQLQVNTGITILFISHDLGVIQRVADAVAVMHHGKIVEYGLAREVLTDPKDTYTKALLACRPPTDRKLIRLPVLQDFTAPDPHTESLGGKSWDAAAITERLETLVSQPPLLKVRNIRTIFQLAGGWGRKRAKPVIAVNNISFDVHPGETLGLVGESGSGKTTLGRSILGLESAATGSVIYEGKDILTLPERQMRRIRKDLQIIFQNPYGSLNPRMTVGQMLSEPIRIFWPDTKPNDRKERVMELLKVVGLQEEHYHRLPRAFSGGQRQRIAIARALAVEPRFIVCDECVSSLDVSVQAQILNLLLDLRDRFDLTYLFISHDLSVIRMISDRIAVMKKGEMVELGGTEDLFSNPVSDYTKTLLASIC